MKRARFILKESENNDQFDLTGLIWAPPRMGEPFLFYQSKDHACDEFNLDKNRHQDFVLPVVTTTAVEEISLDSEENNIFHLKTYNRNTYSLEIYDEVDINSLTEHS